MSTNQETLEKVIQQAIDSGWNNNTNWGMGLPGLFYRHDFAQSLWPDKDGNIYWRMHLQRMVVAKDPIKYLKENT